MKRAKKGTVAMLIAGVFQLSAPANGGHGIGATKPAAPAKQIGPRHSLSDTDRMYDLSTGSTATLVELDNRIKLHPKASEAYVLRGQAYLLDGDMESALKDFTKAIAIDPHCAPAFIGCARVYEAELKYRYAFTMLHRAAELGSPDAKVGALWEAAFVTRENRQLPSALEQYNAVLKLNITPPSRKAFATFQRGEVYDRMGNRKAALADYNAALALDPNLSDARMVRARCYLQLHKLKEALSDYNAAIFVEEKEYPSDSFGELSGSHLVDLYKERAKLYTTLGKPELAKRDLKTLDQYQKQTMDAVPFRSAPDNLNAK